LFYIVLVVKPVHPRMGARVCRGPARRRHPRHDGRVTLNPIVHMDLFGSVIFPLVCTSVVSRRAAVRRGRPVMINPSNFPHRKRDEVLTTLAGPAANLALALLAAVIGGIAYRYEPRVIELVKLVHLAQRGAGGF